MSDAVGLLLGNVLSEDTFKKRLAALTQETDNAEKAKEALRLQTEANQQLLAELQSEGRAIDSARDALKKREDKLAMDTETLGKVINDHNAERDRWVKQREYVDAEQAAHSKRIGELDRWHDAIAGRQTAKQAELDRREEAISVAETRHQEAARHAQAFIRAVAP